MRSLTLVSIIIIIIVNPAAEPRDYILVYIIYRQVPIAVKFTGLCILVGQTPVTMTPRFQFCMFNLCKSKGKWTMPKMCEISTVIRFWFPQGSCGFSSSDILFEYRDRITIQVFVILFISHRDVERCGGGGEEEYVTI